MEIGTGHQGKAKLSLLDSYHAERHPVVSNHIVKQTDKFTQMALTEDDFLKKLRLFMKKSHPPRKILSNK